MNKVGSAVKFISVFSANEYFNTWAEDILSNPSKILILDRLRKATRFVPIGNDITHIKIADRWLVKAGAYWDDRRPCGVYIDDQGQTWGLNGCGENDNTDLITDEDDFYRGTK